jgi:CubicO group peptidase (beta-lactamase class C family)
MPPSPSFRCTGRATAGFAAVRELFDSFLAEDPEYSAQLAVYRDGVKVVDLSGGPHLAPGDVTGTYSCSKGVGAMVIALLLQDGDLDLDRAMSSYWPAFGAHGPAGPVRDPHPPALRNRLLPRVA